jgi:AraC family transcriptional regulator of adaptative response / DNA-3-methyladenine glycosylase II
MDFLADRAVEGMEEAAEGLHRRAMSLPRGEGIVELIPQEDHFLCRFALSEIGDLNAAVARCRALLDLDADPTSIGEVLGATRAFKKAVGASPGLRVPGAMDGFETAIRALVGQQISVRGARTILGLVVARYGTRLERPTGSIRQLFPSAAALAKSDLDDIPMPGRRRQAIKDLSREVAEGRLSLDRGADREETRARLTSIPGIGEWTGAYVAMRALGDPDALPVTDLGIRKGAAALGLPQAPKELARTSQRWSPWRSYAAQYLWVSASNGR